MVGMSILDLAYGAVPSWLVRLMRALRVVRLFGRVRELRKASAAVVYSRRLRVSKVVSPRCAR